MDLAHGELGRAPYAAIRDFGRTLAADDLMTLIAGEEVASRRAAYILLLGAAGGDAAAAWLARRIDAAWQAGDATDLAALLAANLELRGSAQVHRIEERYLLDPTRSLPEIEAALLALSVHGDAATATVPRREVVGAYLGFLRARPPMAGFVATDLARWGEWGATEGFVELLNAGAITDPAGAFAVLSYVQRSPDVAAKARLDVLDD